MTLSAPAVPLSFHQQTPTKLNQINFRLTPNRLLEVDIDRPATYNRSLRGRHAPVSSGGQPMTKWIIAHLPAIATTVSILALVSAIATIIAVRSIARHSDDIISERIRRDPDRDHTLRELSERVNIVDKQVRESQLRFAEQKITVDQCENRISAMIERLAQARQHSLAAKLRDNSHLEQLGTIYKEARQRLEPTVKALAVIGDRVNVLLKVIPVDSAQYQHVKI